MARRSIELRWQGRCSVCLRPLGAGELTLSDDRSHDLVCLACSAEQHRADTTEADRRRTRPARRAETAAERVRIRALIADARAALDAARRAG